MTRRRVGLGSRSAAFIARCTFAVAALGSSVATAQDLAIPEVAYPSLPRQAQTAEGFVPAGWLLEAQVSGDLNRDGNPDLVMVLRQNDPQNVIDDIDGLGEKPFDTNPRILAVAFRDAEKFTLHLENHALIPRRTEPVADDPFDKHGGIGMVRDGFQVRLTWWMSAGGWETFTTTYTFRHQAGRFALIGYDRNTTHRGSGETKALSINYLTRRAKRTTGHIGRDRVATRWLTLPPGEAPMLESIGDGLSFEPEL